MALQKHQVVLVLCENGSSKDWSGLVSPTGAWNATRPRASEIIPKRWRHGGYFGMMRPDLRKLPAKPTTRFAPSPTGPLHIGHVANAVWTWGVAQATGGRVILRLEDHDRSRCRPEHEASILEDLRWLGLEPDEASARSFQGGRSAYRQSDNPERYELALGRVRAAAPVFHCECSRKTIARTLGASGFGEGEELRYPGTCRSKGLEPAVGRGIRVVLPEDEVVWSDLMLGRIAQRPAQQCGDLLLRDPLGSWTYQFAVVVDDWAQEVDLVIRGDDLFASTGRQIQLARILGRATPPAFLHHRLIRDEGGAKLSKRDGAPALANLRAAGKTSLEVLGLAAHLTGLQESPAPIAAGDLGRLFR